MANKPRNDSPPTTYHLDFSGKEKYKELERRGAEADRQLRSDPKYRELTTRMATDEERIASEYGKAGNKRVLAGLAIAGTTTAVDIGAAEIFHMPQLLLGQELTELPQVVAHAAILAIGGVASTIALAKGLIQWSRQSARLQMADRHRRGY